MPWNDDRRKGEEKESENEVKRWFSGTGNGRENDEAWAERDKEKKEANEDEGQTNKWI